MRNRIIMNKIKIIFYILLIVIFKGSSSLSEDFFFEGTEIQILNNGEKLKSDKGVKITSSNNLKITADEFEYDKSKNELILNGNVLIDDELNQTIIKTLKTVYDKNSEIINTFEYTEIEIDNKIFLKTKDLFYSKKNNKLKSNYKTEVIDNYGNVFIVDEFLLNLKNKILKGKNAKLTDKDGNSYKFENFFSDFTNNELYGKDLKVNFSGESFGNQINEPRLYGNIFSSKNNITKISKGSFTTCKKRDNCPPWIITAREVEHNKEKKRISYRDAWLKVYDKPVLYFPKFFHPDPTVKRQSGFLVPQFNDSTNTGTSFQIPYFKVLADNKDMTITPTIFADKSFIVQNEYRRIEKNYEHTSDLSLFSSALSDDNQVSKSHFFSNTNIELEDGYFELSDLEVNLEQVSNDTYLKKYDINSPLIKSESLLHSFVKYEGYNDFSSLDLSMEVYEDLSKKEHDRYEVILPNMNFSKDFSNDLSLLGSLDFSTSFFQKQFQTNSYLQSLNNSLMYSSPRIFQNNGLIQDYKLRITNPNKRSEIGSDNVSDTKNQLFSQLMYTLSFPLKKQSELYNNFLTPNFSYRFSPNITKNISSKDNRLDFSSVNSFNRISDSDTVEGGHSITTSMSYSKVDFAGNEKISFDIAQVVRDKPNPDLPVKSTLNKKYSDVIGKLKINLSEVLNLDYDFMLDDGLQKSNYNSIKTSLNFNKLVTSFEFLEESDLMGQNHYIGNETSYKIDENNSLAFSTRSNREIDMTEFYNLIYQYENDCLRAALEYNKKFYSDGDIKPEEELLFSLTIIPFSKFNSTNLK